jgi:hypothetical protein
MKALMFVALFATLATAALVRAEDKPTQAPAQPMDQKAIDKAIDQTAQAGDGAGAGLPRKVTCKSGDDARIVEIQAREGGGCKVVYTKAGTPQTIGEAQHQTQFCDELLEKLIKRLEGSGFECS